MTPAAVPHVLIMSRGFAADGPGRLILSFLRAVPRGSARFSFIGLERDGPLRKAIALEVRRLGGRTLCMPTPWQEVFGCARRIAKFVRKTGVTHLHAHLMRADVVGRRVAKLTGLPYFVTEHGIHGWSEGPRGTRFLVKLWYLLTLPRRGKVIAISSKVATDLKREGLRADRVTVISNGIDVETLQASVDAINGGAARRSFRTPEEARPVILVLGNLIARKNPIFAVEVFRSYLRLDPESDPRLIFVGSGELLHEVQYTARRYGFSRLVYCAGQIADPARAFAAADVFLHPALEEPFGLAVAEAQAAGIPVLAKAASGADAVAGPWPASLAVDSEDADAWAAGLSRIVAELARDSERVRAACREHAAKELSIKRMVTATLAMYTT